MSIFSFFLDLVFPQPFSKDFFEELPSAPILPDRKLFALYDYHDPRVRKLIFHLKKYTSPSRDALISKELYQSMIENISELQQFSFFLSPLVIIIPPHKDKGRKQANTNQCEHIARLFAKELSGTFDKKLLNKIKQTKKQALINHKQERLKNIKNSFAIKEKNLSKVFQRDIIIIDDLITTGATMNEAIRVLKKAGARNVIGIALAH
ncbi:MAG: phosphoribosyltransferase family protein [Candidatus Pacebacteria bacterium]|nr:phosphoribosyltransferase family protein [Candidatus Paceibacterota bacterium]